MLSPERRKGLYLATAALALLVLFSLRTGSTAAPAIHHSDHAALSNATRDACKRVMDEQKGILHETFSSALAGVRNIALISMPDHHNK